MIAGIDWLVAESARSDSPYFGKLDTNRIAAGGHSRGSISAFGAASDPRLTTTIHVAGGSFDGLGPSNLHAPTAYICGASDTLATPNCQRDYDNTTVPMFFTVMEGVDHYYAARNGLPAITAWLRWHLGGEEDRRAMFLDPNCHLLHGNVGLSEQELVMAIPFRTIRDGYCRRGGRRFRTNVSACRTLTAFLSVSSGRKHA